jgi:DNA-binding CsgD family transcriptional regulator
VEKETAEENAAGGSVGIREVTEWSRPPRRPRGNLIGVSGSQWQYVTGSLNDLRALSAEESAALWSHFVEARWGLVEHGERDGKRFILVRSNETPSKLPLLLARRERRVVMSAVRGSSNKSIAYELGVSPSTVASHLRRALRKLRLGSRRELVQLLGSTDGESAFGLSCPEGLRASRFEVGEEAYAVFESALTDPADSELTRILSEAEQDVAKRALEGKSNPEIARERGTSIRTVANQMASIFSKLGVGSRAELYAVGRRDFLPSRASPMTSGLHAP